MLKALHNAAHTVLLENQAQHDYVNFGNINYYKFTLHGAKNINRIKFGITSFQGEVSMFMSLVHV